MMNVPITVFNCQKKNYDNFFLIFKLLKNMQTGEKRVMVKKKDKRVKKDKWVNVY